MEMRENRRGKERGRGREREASKDVGGGHRRATETSGALQSFVSELRERER